MTKQVMTFGEFMEHHSRGLLKVDSIPNSEDPSDHLDVFERIFDAEIISHGAVYRVETESGRVLLFPETAAVEVQIE